MACGQLSPPLFARILNELGITGRTLVQQLTNGFSTVGSLAEPRVRPSRACADSELAPRQLLTRLRRIRNSKWRLRAAPARGVPRGCLKRGRRGMAGRPASFRCVLARSWYAQLSDLGPNRAKDKWQLTNSAEGSLTGPQRIRPRWTRRHWANLPRVPGLFRAVKADNRVAYGQLPVCDERNMLAAVSLKGPNRGKMRGFSPQIALSGVSQFATQFRSFGVSQFRRLRCGGATLRRSFASISTISD